MNGREPDARVPLPEGSVRAEFISRSKRFLIQARFRQEEIGVHTNNSGSMLGLLRPGAEILVSPARNPLRKLPWTLELARLGELWVGVNTQMPNRMLRVAWETGTIPELRDWGSYRAEVAAGESRLDARLESGGRRLWVEAKNVTLVEDGVAWFPDAETERGRKHLRELAALARGGDEVACFYLIQRADAQCFGPADFIDPEFARLFYRAMKAGVRIWPYRAEINEKWIGLGSKLPLVRP
ncbi:MAG: DNA/RNA nuclease SfsA [Deltaproteobacteria bacterium]|nr:DNA/RNA nuclease SfsA [Deltaproteobacteria bacterium]